MSTQLRITFGLIAIWCLVMISVPILGWTLSEKAQLNGVVLGTVAQAIAVAAALRLEWSWGKIGRIILTIAVITLIVEAVGTATGIPFGRYHYTGKLQPQIFSVPLLIPIAWFIMLPSCWVIAAPWLTSRWRFAAISAAALTSWDLMLDPQMVNWQLWIWENPVGYFGIPWSNFAGWLLVSFCITSLLYPLLKEGLISAEISKPILMLIFSIAWFLETFGLALFWGLPGPAIVGGLIMGFFMLIGWRSLSTQVLRSAFSSTPS